MAFLPFVTLDLAPAATRVIPSARPDDEPQQIRPVLGHGATAMDDIFPVSEP